ncbi:DNA polymerase III subunit gamma/tau [Mycoplasma sp. NEAQ87857]|uniref:DNA polymerase III subunit gamma/tau n=1 Tax=Mycoplasma sp. NEAQ87857 TaxID=2683967 RepID=UPI001319289E|nr:DNA polymerase III subunit gamma/tau [Mycoplasma sp. NEAQ87857]QGZ97894.1 DNA polymerase III subunit gamma/tau [Mycoplasma sp. NEAQ87857]
MSYKALYRKYRPSNFDQVIGQEHIVETLKNIVQSHKIGHAYLFSGPKGTGKTSMAKIFANVLNCMHTDDLVSLCNNCLTQSENNFDVLEMDAASNNGVDEIRDLKEKIEQAPINGRFKVYIIDEVHMLSKSAFNALLKTLEEPPSHAIFILATTDVQKIPLTILSRVQRFNFHRINDANIIKHLTKILDLEKIKYEPKALKAIARLSSGGMRDALSIADQASVFNNNSITLDNLMENFGITSSDQIIEIINLIANQDLINLLNKIDQMQKNGVNWFDFLSNLITINKEWLIYVKCQDPSMLEELNIDQIKLLQLNVDLSMRINDILYDIFINLNKSEFPFEFIELGLMKLFKQQINKPIENNISMVEQITQKRKQETKKIEPVAQPIVNPAPVIQPIKTQDKVNVEPIIKPEFKQEFNNQETINNTIDYELDFVPKNINKTTSKNNEYSIDEIAHIAYFINSNKELRQQSLNQTSNWKKILASASTNPDFQGQYDIFRNCALITAHEDVFIFRCENDEYVNQITNNKTKWMQSFFKNYYRKYINLIAVNPKTLNEVKNRFDIIKNENKINSAFKIPSPLIELDEKSQIEQLNEDALKIFGDTINIIKE